MHKNIYVLGAGMVGSAMSLDLAKKYNVTSIDNSESALNKLYTRNNNIAIKNYDLKQYDTYSTLLQEADLVVCAVPGFMGFKTLEAIIKCGKDVVDISFFPEDGLSLNELAKHHGVTAITDCGVAPGTSNFIIGYYNSKYIINSVEFVVGGLPLIRKYPWEYKAPFSPVDVIEEYTRPARMKENGVIVTKPALSDSRIMNFDKVGSLEAFNTDGLRSLLFTLPEIKNMKEQTLRYIGHIDFVKKLKAAGFFDETEISLNGNKIKPIEFSSKLLIDSWKLGEDEKEFTVMQVKIEAVVDGKESIITYDLYDEYDDNSNQSSMSRTTGYVATAAVEMINQGLFNDKGVFPPELIGPNEACFELLFKHLEARGVIWRKNIS
jgi:saccharopine dehydrogenase-like NADP-dependent oxidoreductase